MTFNELIVKEPEEAAAKVVDALRYCINTCVPEMYLSRDEWETLLPYVVENMNSASKPDSLSVKTPVQVSETSKSNKSDKGADAVG